MKINKGIIFTIIIGIALILIIYFLAFGMNKDSFSLSTLYLKSVLKQGEVSSSILKITNLAEQESFAIQTRELDDLISLSNANFTSEENEQAIEVIFNATKAEPGIYVGSISVDNGKDIKILPVIMEVQTPQILYAVNLDVNPDYKNVKVGEKTLTNVKFFNLNDTLTHEVLVEYAIKDIDGKSVVSVLENASVTSKYEITKVVNLPEDIKPGMYVYSVILNYSDSLSTSSYLFEVSGKGLPFELNFFSIVIIFFLLAIVIVVIYIVYERNKLFNELEDQHKSAISFYSDNIDKQKLEEMNKVKTEEEKQKILKEFDEAKQKIISQIRKEQEKQLNELRKLEKKKSTEKKIKQKIKSWKKEGYKSAVKSVKIDPGLKSKLEALEKARTAGLISSESFSKGSSRIKKLMKE